MLCVLAALIFEGIGFFDVGFLVMTGKLDRLASHLIPLSPQMAARGQADLVELLKSRLQPICW